MVDGNARPRDKGFYLIAANVEYLVTRLGGTPRACPERPRTGTMLVHVTQRNAEDRVVNAQGIDVSIAGPTAKIQPTGWGAASGEARFEDLPPGQYTVRALGKTARVTVTAGEEVRVDLGP